MFLERALSVLFLRIEKDIFALATCSPLLAVFFFFCFIYLFIYFYLTMSVLYVLSRMYYISLQGGHEIQPIVLSQHWYILLFFLRIQINKLFPLYPVDWNDLSGWPTDLLGLVEETLPVSVQLSVNKIKLIIIPSDYIFRVQLGIISAEVRHNVM